MNDEFGIEENVGILQLRPEFEETMINNELFWFIKKPELKTETFLKSEF